MKIKKNDTVKIITGKDRGKTGKVIKIFPIKGRILVEGLNLFKKHVKPRREGEKGQVIEVPRPLTASNAMIVCGACNKTIRIGYVFEGDKKLRICKKCKAKI